METITELESRARFPHHAYVTVLENKLARMKEELERRNVSWFPSTQVEDVPEEAPYPEPEPAPMEGQTPTTPKEREKLARRFGRDIGTLMRNMQRPTPPYPDAADAIRAGIEKITDAEGQEEMLRAWRGYVDGDPKAEKVIRLWVDGGGLFDAPAPKDTPPPPQPAREPAPKAPRKPRTTVVEPEPMMESALGIETPQDDARAMVDRLRGRDKTILQDAIDDRDAGDMRPTEFKEVMDMVAKRNPVKNEGPAKTPPATLRKVKERLAMEEGNVLATTMLTEDETARVKELFAAERDAVDAGADRQAFTDERNAIVSDAKGRGPSRHSDAARAVVRRMQYKADSKRRACRHGEDARSQEVTNRVTGAEGTAWLT